MKTVILNCTAAEPLVITSGSAESMAHECLGYIPGNMLLGALAAVWKHRNRGLNPDSSPEFQQLFLNGDILWGHALPLCGDHMSTPIPASYMYDKEHAALPPQDGDFEPAEYWVANMLTPQEAGEIASPWQKKNFVRGGKLRRVGNGFMDPHTLHRVVERRVFNIHVALGQKRAAQEGYLYGYSALAKDSKLRSRILCKDESAARVLLELVREVRSLRVGHARSAGYGRINIQCQETELPEQLSAPQKVFILFLESQFMPSPAWAEPQEALCRELGRLAGKEPRITECYVSQEEIQGYNGLWNRPRTSRACLTMGGVLRIEFAEPVALPLVFSIGASQVEGYGRILADPEFLLAAEPVIAAPQVAHSARSVAPAPAPANLPLWRLLRERIAARQMLEQARIWLNEPGWRRFLEDAKRLERPTASQRNNLRHMDVQTFKAMLEKTPGEQWRQAVAYSPFTGRKDHLSEIIGSLLEPAEFCGRWKFSPVDLPGAFDAEAEALACQRLFIRQLVATWNKLSRLSPDKD